MPRLFSCYGVELEYMIVDRASLDVRPIADRLLAAANGGEIAGDVERGTIAWSNELTAHLVEFKCNGPAVALDGLEHRFQDNVAEATRLLEPLGAQLLPGGMHPWMDPLRETQLWQHEYSAVYEAFDRIFGCQGHGWSNLQSTHLNVPFEGDEEFGRLHAAIRLVLPLLPALAASTPVMDGRVTGFRDNRLEVYRTNSRKVPMVAGRVIPEPAFSEAEYDRQIFQPLFEQIAPYDPDEILREEWLNARGAIARFSRGSIEIRVLDIQEHPAADLAICQLATAVLQALVAERWSALDRQQAADTEFLASVFLETIRHAEDAPVPADLLALFGRASPLTAGTLWRSLADELRPNLNLSAACQTALQTILTQGTLATRLIRVLGPHPTRDALQAAWRRLGESLRLGVPFVAS